MSPGRSNAPAADVVIKGVRDEPSPDDGRRVLADRLWPRGVSKERAALDEWAKDATPSTALRRALHSGDPTWEQFVPAYRAELEEEPRAVHCAQRCPRAFRMLRIDDAGRGADRRTRTVDGDALLGCRHEL